MRKFWDKWYKVILRVDDGRFSDDDYAMLS